MSVRCQGSRIPWTNSLTRRHCPATSQDQKLPTKTVVPENQKGPTEIHRFVNYYRNYIPRLSEKIAPFHELVKADKPIKITNEIMQTFENINKALDNACGLWLKQPLPNKQYVLMTDANFKNAGYALMIEENADEKLTSVQKDIRTSCVWIQNILAVTNQNVDICQGIPGYIFCLHGIQPHLVGIDQTGHRPNRQQICYTFFPNQNNTTSVVERLRFRPTV